MQDNQNLPNYFSIIPARVRYDNDLSSSEKLLYSELTALANYKGYCYATNRYFAQLYNVSISTVSRWISKLEKKHYIYCSYSKKPNSKEQFRKIYITNLEKTIDNIDNDNNDNIDDSVDILALFKEVYAGASEV